MANIYHIPENIFQIIVIKSGMYFSSTANDNVISNMGDFKDLNINTLAKKTFVSAFRQIPPIAHSIF